MADAAAFAYLAMQQAIEDAGLEPRQVSNERTGIIAGSGGASSSSQTEAADILRNAACAASASYRVTQTMGSTVSACLATPFAYPRHQLLDLLRLLHQRPLHRQRDGTDPARQAGCRIRRRWRGTALDHERLFDAMGALSTRYNDDRRACFARLRCRSRRLCYRRRRRHAGAGGAGARQARGAKIYAELVGYGATSDGYDMVAPRARARCAACARRWRPSTGRSTTSMPTARARRRAISRS
jgi:3-oxoacyl-[acyl-carrier-protein] synthase-1